MCAHDDGPNYVVDAGAQAAACHNGAFGLRRVEIDMLPGPGFFEFAGYILSVFNDFIGQVEGHFGGIVHISAVRQRVLNFAGAKGGDGGINMGGINMGYMVHDGSLNGHA
jgi:hypothetical protein